MAEESTAPRQVLVPWERVAGWFKRYEQRHADTRWWVDGGVLHGDSPDGSRVSLSIPFDDATLSSPSDIAVHLGKPWRLGVVLVRRGGFAVAYVVGADIVESKVGKRHVQGKTKAGGWSQQRFANRRDNQAKVAFAAAAGHVEEILLPHAGRLDLVISAGDRQAADAVWAQPRLRPLTTRPQRWLGGVADPRRDVLEQAVATARSVTISLTDPPADP